MREWAPLEAQGIPFNVIYCDDIRREDNGKQILIGVYSGDIVIPSVPTTIKIALWVQTRTKGKGKIRMRVRVTDPGGNTAGEMNFEQSVEGSNEDEVIESAVGLPTLAVSVIKPGLINVFCAMGDNTYLLCGEKKVRIGPVVSAPEPAAV